MIIGILCCSATLCFIPKLAFIPGLDLFTRFLTFFILKCSKREQNPTQSAPTQEWNQNWNIPRPADF